MTDKNRGRLVAQNFPINRSRHQGLDKPNTAKGTPRSATIAKMVQVYETNCEKLAEMMLRLNCANDVSDLEALQKELAAKEVKLGNKIGAKKQSISKQVLRYNVEELRAILAHRKEVEDIKVKIAGIELQQKSTKSKKRVLALEEECAALRKTLATLEMSDKEKFELQLDINKLKDTLNSSLWSLMQYEEELNDDTLEYMKVTQETLKLKPRMGTTVPRGWSYHRGSH